MVRSVSLPSQCGLSKAIYKNKNIIISAYVICYILPYQLIHMTQHQKVVYVFEVCIYSNSMCEYLISFRKKH